MIIFYLYFVVVVANKQYVKNSFKNSMNSYLNEEYIIKSSTCLLIYKYYLIDREIIRNSDVMHDESNGYPILKMILKIYQPIGSIQFSLCTARTEELYGNSS